MVNPNQFIATTVELGDLLTNHKTTSDVFHLVSIKSSSKIDINKLLVFNGEDSYTYFIKDRFMRHLSHIEKLLKYFKRKGKTKEELDIAFTVIPYIQKDGYVDLMYSEELMKLIYEYFTEQKIINYYYNDFGLLKLLHQNGKTLNIADLKGDGDIAKSFAFIRSYVEFREQLKTNLAVGQTCNYATTTTITMYYISHTEALREQSNDKFIIDPITFDRKLFSKTSSFRYTTGKNVASLFLTEDKVDEDTFFTIAMPIIIGLNHAIPITNIKPYQLDMVIWKEDQTIRLNCVFHDEDFHVISFMPQTNFFMYGKF